jgi:tuberous sclerosis protein 2
LLDRALTVLDRTPCLNTHKIGLIYVGKKQKTQKEILGNKDGSPKFVKLLSSLGLFVQLSKCRSNGWYTGGLDCDTGSDGEFGLFWKDDGCQVVFHVPVMQQAVVTPTSTANIQQREQQERNNVNNKKRHIGNDYVHIVYSDNEDALSYPYRQDTITGQFNFVHIVVRPSGEKYYSIEVKTKEELEEVGLFPSHQICHEDYLAPIVRDMALSYDLACKVYHGQGMDYSNNKLERLNQIKRIKKRLTR